MTVLEIILIALLWTVADTFSSFDDLLLHPGKLMVLILIGYPLFAQLDARSRFQDYKKIKDQLYRYGFQERIIRPVLKSRCQRDAAMMAAIELGMGYEIREMYFYNGYRWYHILPDFFFTNPGFLLSKYFWRTTFFTKRYEPILDYRTIHSRQSLLVTVLSWKNQKNKLYQ
jgi:hypothetical protein